ATKIADTTVVSRKARTLLRGRRLLALRGRRLLALRGRRLLTLGGRSVGATCLRCCDNAVLPSARHYRQVARAQDRSRPRHPSLLLTWRPEGPPGTGQEEQNAR